MHREIIWSPLAEKDFNDISEYLAKEWNNKIVNNFILLVDHLIEQIKNNPKQYSIINTELEVRKCVISKHNSIYYKASSNQVNILRIFDTRQDPESLKFA